MIDYQAHVHAHKTLGEKNVFEIFVARNFVLFFLFATALADGWRLSELVDRVRQG